MNGTVKVVYEFIDGAHFFTSAEKDAEGLCVASTDPVAAFNDVTTQLNALAAAKGLPANYKPAAPVEDFSSWLETHGISTSDTVETAIKSLAQAVWISGKEAA